MDRDPQPAPVFVAPAPDPALAILQKQTDAQNIEAMKNQAQLDTSHLMHQYGVMTALQGNGSPLTAAMPTTANVSASNIAGSPLVQQAANTLFNKAA